jgi:M6 family metalloprotease-like protein
MQDTAFYAAVSPYRDWTRNANLAKEICELSNVDWAAIDANHDHVITRHEAQICFMLAAGGAGANRPANITISTQTGSYAVHASFVFFDCKRNDDPTRGTDAIKYNYGTIWHEMSHGMFGLPDRYTNYAGSGRTGHFDLMSDNYSWKHLSIYDKMKIGWIRPKILVKPSQRADHQRHCYAFPNTETTPAALILWDANQPDEYWIVENRYKGGSPRNFDRGLSESGMAIWWVNERVDSLSLVDARNIANPPQRINYSTFDDQVRAIFKNRTGTRDESFDMQFLKSSYNFTEMAIRAVSPEGTTMYAEF